MVTYYRNVLFLNYHRAPFLFLVLAILSFECVHRINRGIEGHTRAIVYLGIICDLLQVQVTPPVV